MKKWLLRISFIMKEYSNLPEFFIVKDIYQIAFPASVSAIIGMFMELACLRIVGGFDAESYYIIALFVPISYFLLAVSECYRTPMVAFSSVLEARKELPLLGNHILIVCLLSTITVIVSLVLFTAFSGLISRVLSIEKSHSLIFYLYSLLVIGFATIRCCSFNLVGVLYCIGKQRLAMNIALLSGFAVCGLTYGFAFYTTKAVLAFAYSSAICSIAVCLIAGVELFAQGVFKEVQFRFIKEQFLLISRDVYRIGAPVFISYIIIFMSLFVFNIILAPFGNTIVTGFGIGYRIQSLLILPAISIGIATAILINKCIARKQIEETNHILKISIVLTLIIYMLLAVFTFVFRDSIVSWIVQDEPIHYWAVMYLYCIAPSYVALGPLLMFIMVLEQTGLGLKSLMINAVSFLSSILLGGFLAVHKQDATLVFYSIGVVNILYFVLVLICCFGFSSKIFGTNRVFSQ